jgi:hypothetical protein
MLGFTSCGVGVSGVPVRFATQGEVLLITLKRDPDRDKASAPQARWTISASDL